MQASTVAAILLLAATTSLAEQASYVAIVPSVIRPGTPRDISVTIMDHVTSDVTVTATMTVMVDEQSETITVTEICQPGTLTMLELPIPNDLDSGRYILTLTGTGGVEFRNETEVTADLKFLTVLVQTDKATYKPGDLVRFRALAVYSDMTPYLDYMEILAMDGNENKIKQYPAPSSDPDPVSPNAETGVFEGQLQLSEEPVTGTWKIKVDAKGQTKIKEFEVEEYVLPKYEVKLTVPDFLHDGMDRMPITVEAKYTYGQPVEGEACFIAQIANQYRGNTYRVHQHCMQLENGRASYTIPIESRPGSIEPALTDLLRVCDWCRHDRDSMRYQEFKVDAEVTETLTGNVLVDNKTVKYENSKLKMEFLESTPDTFKSNLNYTAYLQLKQANDAAPEETDLTTANGSLIPIHLDAYYSYVGVNERGDRVSRDRTNQYEFAVGPGGITALVIAVPERFSSIRLTARFMNPPATSTYGLSAYKSLEEFKNRDNEAIQIGFSLSQPVQSGEMITFDVTTSAAVSKYSWEIYSKGAIVTSGRVELDTANTRSSFVVNFTPVLAQAASPSARILVYYFTSSGEVVADSIEFSVDALFANQVSLSFAETEEVSPRTNVSLTVHARPESYIGLLAVDKSVKLLRSGNDLNQDEVKEDFTKYDSNSASWDGGYPEPRGERGRRRRRSVCFRCYYPVYSGGSDATELFEYAGLTVLTNGYIHEEEEEVFFYYSGAPRGPTGPMGADGRPGSAGERGQAGAAGAAGERGQAGARGETGPQGPAGPVSNQDRAGAPGAPTSELQQPTTVRSDFSDTWLWSETVTGPDGTVTMQYSVPDTITSWVASAFAMHPTYGLGIAPDTAEVTVFKPFFASLNLPYSVVRGERFRLQVIVFNYDSAPQTVRVTLKGSTQFMIDSRDGAESTGLDVWKEIEVAQGAGENAFFWIEPLELGNIDIEVMAQTTQVADALRRTLIVEPEGMPESFTQAWFVDLSDTSSSPLSHTFTVGFPDDTVAGSQHIRVSAMSDLMGTTIDNLDSLVRMPYGCGEQNMINFAPNIYVMDYLTATDQVTNEIETKAKQFMEQGYQRQLTFQRTDGSFSAFGQSDTSGSSWLTAFVARCFNQARAYLPMDQAKINRALTFIVNQQDRDGSFLEPGRVIHSDMQGGSSRGVAMTAYVLIALLENGQRDLGDDTLQTSLDSAVSQALTLIINELPRKYDEEQRYALSVMTYALTLAANMDNPDPAVVSAADEALGYLEELSTGSGSVRYWTEDGQTIDTAEDTGCSCYCPKPKSNAIEMTAYALLTYAVREDISSGLPIMKWLVTQRNSFGGYGSTQDTVIGIMALSRFAAVYSGSGSSLSLAIAMRGLDADDNEVFSQSFNNITAANARIYQFRDVPTDITRIEMTATGEGVALVQMSATYHVMEEPESGIVQECTSEMDERSGNVVVRCCASWMDENVVSGMVVSEMQLLSGYSVLTESVKELNPDIGLRRYEMSNGKLIFYFDELTNETICFEAHQASVTPVEKHQPAVVRTYQYYEVETRNSIAYLPEALMSVVIPVATEGPGVSGTEQKNISLMAVAILALIHFL